MSDFNDDMNYGPEIENNEGLSKEDLAGAGLIGAAMIVGIGAYEGGKKLVHVVGEKLDKKDMNPVTKLKQKRLERKLNKEADKLAKQKMREEILAQAAEKANEESDTK